MISMAGWPLLLARSVGPSLVAAFVLALSRPSWPLWIAHTFFLVMVVPAAILTVDRVLGGRPALALGAAVVVTTAWLAVGPIPVTTVNPLGGSAAWVSDAALAQHKWNLPLRSSGWQAAWEQTELAFVRVCLDAPDDAQSHGVAVSLNGVQLPALAQERERCHGGPWFRAPVTRDQLESLPETTVEFQPERGNLAAAEMVWGYSLRPTAGASASRYFDGERWHEEDLAPGSAGVQSGRYVVELWLFDRYGGVVMTWY
ncbi:MAG: hypothetical protein CL878_13720 [Dehalococcoidia bacterium]|nr:hypothetical protein [Dehalococcoidia bacterium]